MYTPSLSTLLRTVITGATIALALLVPTSSAFAATVTNDLVATGNVTFAAGGSTTISYSIAASTACNPANLSAAVFWVDVPTGLTADVDGGTFVNCTSTAALTFSSSTPGTYLLVPHIIDSGMDDAYNLAPGTVTLTVTSGEPTSPFYAWSNVLQPINADGSSSFKINSTVPVKFKLTGISAGISTAYATITLVKIDGTADGTAVESSSTVAATVGNAFRYDATSDTYVYNLATKGQSNGDYRVDIDLHDGAGARRSPKFSLRR